MIISIIGVLFTFGIVIFLHEFGHFLVCKLVKVKVEEFSFGFGKALKTWKKGDTAYHVRLVPLGGYVRPAGENIEEATGADFEYFSKPWYTRLGIVVAGPFMNYVLAFCIFAFVIFFVGKPIPSSQPVIGELASGYPAQGAGLKVGDRIVSVNGIKVDSWMQMAKIIHKYLEKEIVIEYSRGEMVRKMKIKTKKGPSGRYGMIGISPRIEYEKIGLLKSIKMGAYQCYYWTAFTLSTLASNIYHREKPDIAGPIGIIDIVGKAAHSGFSNFMFLVGLISVAVGLFNLLPIPLLDGGHAIMYICEGIIRRKITVNVMKVANSIGIAFLVFILLFATYNDILRIVNSKFKKQAAPAASQK